MQGLGDALSSSAELSFIKAEHQREAWEFKEHPEGEIAEMVELYQAKGVSAEDASTLARTLAKYPEVFLPTHVQEELGLPPVDDGASPAKDGLVTFISFLAFGSVPMWAYLILWAARYTNPGGVFGIACAATALTMFALGATQAVITRGPVLKTGLLMTINGSLAAASAYAVGFGLERAIGNGV